MARLRSFVPTDKNLEVIRRNRASAMRLEARKVPCLCCGHHTITIHQKTSEPIFISQKCSLCRTEATYNLADYRRGTSLRSYGRNKRSMRLSTTK